MSSGLKIGLIVAGAGVLGLLILRSSATAAALPTTTATPAPTGFAGLLSKLGLGGNTAPAPAGVAATPPTTALAPAPGAPSSSSLSKVASGIWSVDKSVIGGVGGVAKSVVGTAGSVAKTVVGGAVGVAGGVLHSVLSIF